MTASIRQMSANRNKVVKFFSKGFLVEEPIHALLDPSGTAGEEPAWFWNGAPIEADPRRRLLSDGSPSPVEPWQGLYAIEAQLASLLASGGSASAIRQVRKKLESWLKEHLTEEGLLTHAPWESFSILPSLFRIRLGLAKLDWPPASESAFQNLLAASYRTSTKEGWAFSPRSRSSSFRSLLEGCCKTPAGKEWVTVDRWLRGESGIAFRKKTPDPSLQSDAARFAVLRRDWSSNPTLIACRHSDRRFEVLWQALGTTLIEGEWKSSVFIDKRPVSPIGEWDATCWYADRDGDYLELVQAHDHGVTLERQIFLARSVHLLLIADTVKTTTPASIRLQWSLPVRNIDGLVDAAGSRAKDVDGPAFPNRLLPIGQPAHPREVAGGRLEVAGSELIFEASTHGGRLFLPLVWVWHPRRMTLQQAWRPLTVTNDRRLVDSQEAVAFRIPVEDQQVVFFRAQEQRRRYAFVGHQTLNECVIGNLDSAGDLQEWLIVE